MTAAFQSDDEEPAFVQRDRSYQHRYYLAHREAKIVYQRAWWAEHGDKANARRRKPPDELGFTPRGIVATDKTEYNRRYHTEVKAEQFFRDRIRALQLVSGLARPQCRACHEPDIRCLTINHRNGGGGLERQVVRHRQFLAGIIVGTRPTGDLEVLCSNCNVRFEYERGRIRLPRGWEAILAEETSG